MEIGTGTTEEHRIKIGSTILVKRKTVVIEIGTGTAIPTVRIEGERFVSRCPNATLIRINPREFEIGGKNEYSVPLGGLEGIKTVLDKR